MVVVEKVEREVFEWRHLLHVEDFVMVKIEIEGWKLLESVVVKHYVIDDVKVFESLKFLQRHLFRSLEDWEVSSLQFMQRYRNWRRLLKLKRVVSLLEGLQGGKKIVLCQKE
ncbi:hypothetical protein Tco_0410438 [Tanacetum coccineum]